MKNSKLNYVIFQDYNIHLHNYNAMLYIEKKVEITNFNKNEDLINSGIECHAK